MLYWVLGALMLGVLLVILLGIGNMLRTSPESNRTSNRLMVARVILQGLALGVVLLILVAGK